MRELEPTSHGSEVASFVRRQNALFLLERLDFAREHDLEEQPFLEHLEQLAARQLASTLKHLAPSLPIFDVELSARSFTVQER